MDKIVVFVVGCAVGAVATVNYNNPRDEFAADREYCRQWVAETKYPAVDVALRNCLDARMQRKEAK